MNYLGPKVLANFRHTEPRPDSRAHRKDSAHLESIRMLPCCVCGWTYQNDAHHLLSAGGRGIAQKAEDWKTVPLCRACHTELHKRSSTKTEAEWFATNGVPWVNQLAQRLYRLSGDHEAQEYIIGLHRSKT